MVSSGPSDTDEVDQKTPVLNNDQVDIEEVNFVLVKNNSVSE